MMQQRLAVAEDGTMMEPVGRTRDYISFGPFKLVSSERLLGADH